VLKPHLAGKIPKTVIMWIILMGILVTGIISVLGYSGALPLYYVDNLFYDSLMRSQTTGSTSDEVLVVDVDERSITEIGQWPWPRYRMAQLIEKLAAMQPAAIGLDIIYAEPDRTSPTTLQESFRNDFDLDVAFSGIPENLKDNDKLLGESLAGTRAVGANYFYFDESVPEESCLQATFLIEDDRGLLDLFDAPRALCNTPAIQEQLRFNGYINSMLDADGMMRRLPLLIEHDGIIYPNLSLATFMRSLEIDYAEVTEGKFGPVLRVGAYSVPITEKGFAFLRFNGPAQQQATMSAADIMNGNVRQEQIQDKIIFIGTSAVGLSDTVPTPVDARFPGVHAHSLMVDNILSSSTIYKPSWAGVVNLVGSILSGLLMVLVFMRGTGPVRLLFGTLALSLIFLLLSVVFFLAEDVFISPGRPILVAAGLFAFFSAVRFALEKRTAFMWYQQLANVQQVTIESMATVAETRDPETGAHIKRTQYYVRAIAQQLMEQKKFQEILNDEFIEMLFLSAPLHDIGKVGVPDRILQKPGKLSDEEYDEMKRHTEYGRKTLFSTMEKIEGDNFLHVAGEIAYSHHEKWDGTGYPEGLVGDDIPLSGRLMSIADVYDALTSKRCYKEPFSHEKAKTIMLDGRATFFDPAVLDAFFDIESTIITIASEIQDDEEQI
jgi:adenylate cyclase